MKNYIPILEIEWKRFMIKSKKLISIIVFLCVEFSTLFAKSLNNSRVGVFSEIAGDVSKIDSLLLEGTVKDKIESNLKKYTELTIVSTNIPELKNIQKATQETGIDKTTAVRMGKLMAADNLLNATVRKSGSAFSVSIKMIDLTTGEVLASVQEKAKDSDSIWTGNGCAIDLLTIELCEAVNIDLSASQKYVLRYGEKDLSTSEQLKLFQQDCERYQKLIDELNKEISLLDYSTDLDAKEKQIAIQAQKEIAEQKLASSLAAQQRMEELRRIQLEEERKEAERSEEQKRKRQEIEAIAQKKINDLRNEKRNKISAIEEIAYIENEKRTYLEIKNSVNDRIKEIEDEKEAEIAKAKEEINSRPYRKAHLDADGNPIPEALQLRREEYAAKAAEIRAEKSKEIEKVQKSVSSNMTELLNLIDTDTKRLAKTKRTASSITDELSVVMGLYDGSKRSWITHLYFTVDGRDLYHQEIELPYETVTGKKITSIMDSDYLDTVDLYDSLFSRGTPVIIFDLDYTVEAMPKDRPSMYRFNFQTLTLKDTKQNLKVLQKQTLDHQKVLHISPAYDIRNDKELQVVVKTEEKKQKNEVKKVAVKNKFSSLRRESYAITVDLLGDEKQEESGVGFEIDMPIAGPLFGGFNGGIYYPYEESNKNKKSGTDDEDVGVILMGYAGVNLPLINGLCDIYAKVGLGGALNVMSRYDFLYSTAFGMEIYAFQVEYGIDYFTNGDYFQKLSIGLSSRYFTK